MSAIPASVVRAAVADVLYARRQRLLNRTSHNPRSAPAPKDTGRRTEIDRLQEATHAVRSLRVKGEVRADVAALLIAWASGWQAAIAELEAIDPRIESLSSHDIVAACRLLLEVK